MIGRLLTNFFYFLTGIGVLILLIVLPIFTITNSLNSFQDFGIPARTASVDFLFQPLRGENCLVVPPVGIVARVLHYMKYQDASGTLVVPFWPSAHYWRFIKHKYGDYVIAHAIRAGKEVLTHGRNHNSLLGSHQFTGFIIALRMEFNEL